VKLETVLVALLIALALAVGVSVAFESDDCDGRGGVLVKNAWGGLTCVRVTP